MITKQEAFTKISELVARFEEQIDSYKQTDYNETLTRRDFIDPFFKALGWDVDNSREYAEAYREVIHEDRVKIGNKVELFIQLNVELKTANIPSKAEQLQTRIDHTENRINQLVYQLYGLTEKEIALVEGETKRDG